MKKEVIFTVGLPASGKTTWANEMIKNGNGLIKRLNKDDLRSMVDNGKYTKENEEIINLLLVSMINSLLFKDSVRTVIIDGCNLKKHIDDFKRLNRHIVHYIEKVFDVSPEMCIERNKIRNNGLPERAIWDILARYQSEGRFTDFNLKSDSIVPWIGFDLDGTIAHYDGWKGPEHIGPPIPKMMSLLRALIKEGKKIKIFTARACIPEQIPYVRKWLVDNDLGDLEITNEKDYRMIMLYDDRCIQVATNEFIKFPEKSVY